MKDNNLGYNWGNLDSLEKQWFLNRAEDWFNDKNKNLYQYSKEQVEEKAKEIFDMKEMIFDSRYYFPVAARELLSRYDIVIEKDGVKFLTGVDDIEECRRIKKALVTFLNSPSELNRWWKRESVVSQLEDVNTENVW